MDNGVQIHLLPPDFSGLAEVGQMSIQLFQRPRRE